MMVLKSCKGRVCADPWRQLHPSGDVLRLEHSLETEFDGFYHEQPKVSFTACKLGYLPEFEGPTHANQFSNKDRNGEPWLLTLNDQKTLAQWSIWT